MRSPTFQTVGSLGSREETIKPKVSTVVAGALTSMLMIGAGLTLAWWTKQRAFENPSRFFDIIGSIGLITIGILLAVLGIVAAWSMRGLASSAVTICKKGFYCSRLGRVSVFGYADIERVNETIVRDELAASDVTDKDAPVASKYSYEVYRCDGKRFYFDSSSLPRVSVLSAPLKRAKLEHGFEWNRIEA